METILKFNDILRETQSFEERIKDKIDDKVSENYSASYYFCT